LSRGLFFAMMPRMTKNSPYNYLILLVFLAVISVFSFSACSKKPIEIGRTNPDQEIKKCIKLSEKKHFEDAIECLEIFKSRFPKSKWGIEAELMIGDNYFRRKEYLLAADSYQAFVKLHPIHPKIDYAYYRTGVSYAKHSPKAIDRDQEYLDDAIANLSIVTKNFPQSAYYNVSRVTLLEARTKIAKRHFYVGRFYYRTGEYIAAIPRFQEIVENYPDSGLLPKSLYLMTVSNIRLSRLDDAKESFSILATRFSDSDYVPKAQKRLLRATKKRESSLW